MKFLIISEGDIDTGIPCLEFEVHVKGTDALDDAWKENFTEYFKKDLKEYFDLETRCKVYSESDLVEMDCDHKWQD